MEYFTRESIPPVEAAMSGEGILDQGVPTTLGSAEVVTDRFRS
jgi:hypothetical protein